VVGAKRGTWFEVLWRIGFEPLCAARADTTVQDDPCDVGFDLGQFDPVVALHHRLRRDRDIGLAVLAVGCHHIASPGRVRVQRAGRAGVPLARLLVGWRAVGLVSLRRRGAGVLRGLRRAGQFVDPRLQGGDAGVLYGDPLILLGELKRLRRDDLLACRQTGDQGRDDGVLLGVAQLAGIGCRGHPALRI